MTLPRTAALGLAVLAGFAALAITVPGQASAATAYRYWAFISGTARVGSTRRAGLRRNTRSTATSRGGDSRSRLTPRTGCCPEPRPTSRELCASNPAKTGEIRVGVVIDFGLVDRRARATSDRRPASCLAAFTCVTAKPTWTCWRRLPAIRMGTGSYVGLVCGIDGYPKTECAVAAATHSAAPAPASSTRTLGSDQQPGRDKASTNVTEPRRQFARQGAAVAGRNVGHRAGTVI